MSLCSKSSWISPFNQFQQAPQSPWDRHRADLSNSRKTGKLNGLFAAFLTALEDTLPTVYQQARVWFLTESIIKESETSNSAGPHQITIDEVEQHLVARFDYETLLNRQIGGKDPPFTPSLDDQTLFYNCKTSAFCTFASKKQAQTSEVIAKLELLFADIQQFANNNPQETDAKRFQMGDEYRGGQA